MDSHLVTEKKMGRRGFGRGVHGLRNTGVREICGGLIALAAFAGAAFDVSAGVHRTGIYAALAAGLDEFGSRRAYLQPVQASGEFIVQNVSGPAGEALPLTIQLPRNTAETYTFLMFRGLPQGFNLSAGFRSKDQWVVSLRDIGDLKLLPPPAFSGVFAVEALLVRGQEQPPDRRIVTVEFLARKQPFAPAATASLGAVDPADKVRPTTAVESAPAARSGGSRPPAKDPAEEDRLMQERADRLLSEGDVAAARLLYARLAHRGIAEAAFAMARSYDPEFLMTIPTAGLQPDLAKAREWYRKAEELGSGQATTRLSTLDKSGR